MFDLGSPDDFTVDELVASWLQAALLGRVAALKKLMSVPPRGPEDVAKGTMLMIECDLLTKLAEQAKSGTLSNGARMLGFEDGIPVSDKTPHGPDISEEELAKVVQTIKETLGVDVSEAAEMLKEDAEVPEEPKAEKPDTPDLNWSFK